MDYKDESGEVALLGSGEKVNERTEGLRCREEVGG